MNFFAKFYNGLLYVKRGVDFVRDFFKIFDWLSEVFKYAAETYPYSKEGIPNVKVESKDTNDLAKYEEVK